MVLCLESSGPGVQVVTLTLIEPLARRAVRYVHENPGKDQNQQLMYPINKYSVYICYRASLLHWVSCSHTVYFIFSVTKPSC